MKLKLNRKTFTLVLAVLIGTAMTPCVLHAQSQSSTTTSTSTSTSKASKRKAARAAKKAAKAEKAAKEKASAATSTAASSSSQAAANAEASAKTSHKSHETAAANTASATPPGPGMVWVNTSSKVYHKAGSKWAGKTKHGQWMSEADAQKAGYKEAKN